MLAVLAVCLAASGLALGAFLAVITARSLGVFLVALFCVLLVALFCVFLVAASLCVFLVAASLCVLLLAASLFLLAAFFLVLVALMVLGAGICCSAHHRHDHHGTEQNLFHIVFVVNVIKSVAKVMKRMVPSKFYNDK